MDVVRTSAEGDKEGNTVERHRYMKVGETGNDEETRFPRGTPPSGTELKKWCYCRREGGNSGG